jgi:hypothetical protein
MVPVMGERPQIMHANIDNFCLTRPPYDAVLQRPAKKVRKNRDDLELHGEARSRK